MRFFAIFLSLDDKFSLNVRAIIPCDNVQHLVKTLNFCVCMCVCVCVGGGGGGGGESGLKIRLFVIFQVWFISFPLTCIE